MTKGWFHDDCLGAAKAHERSGGDGGSVFCCKFSNIVGYGVRSASPATVPHHHALDEVPYNSSPAQHSYEQVFYFFSNILILLLRPAVLQCKFPHAKPVQ